MYTECPNCHTVFRISEELLAVADGKVRCGQCRAVFNAREQLNEEIPGLDADSGRISESSAAAAQVSQEPVEPLDLDLDLDALAEDDGESSTMAVQQSEALSIALDELADLDEAATKPGRSEPLDVSLDLADDNVSLSTENLDNGDDRARSGDSSLPELSELEPLEESSSSFAASEPAAMNPADYVQQELAADKPKRRVLANAAWLLSVVLLVTVLIGQYLYFNRASLAQYGAVRPALTAVCAVVSLIKPCQVPERRDVAAIALVEREVRSHPGQAGALLITATLVSRAEFVQPYPKLELRFYDINRNLLAWRRFEPQEYVLDKAAIAAGMIPDKPVQARLEIVDPGPEAVNFEFDFR